MKDQRGSAHLPIILALFFGAAVVVTIFGYMLWPKDSDTDMSAVVDVNKVVAAKNDNGNANTNNNVNASVNTNGNANSNSNTNTTVDPLAGWKTYTNTAWGFSFKYPSEWSVLTNNLQPKGEFGLIPNEVRVGVGDRPYFTFFVDPSGFGSSNVHKIFTIQKSGKTLVVTKAAATGAEIGEFGLTEYYRVRANEDVDTASPRFYIDFQSNVKSTNDASTDTLFRNILTSFTFTN